MIVSPSIEGIARRLTELLPTVDLPDSFLQWQAQLLSNYSGHVFVPHGVETSTPTLWQAVLESSLAQLSMQAEIAELRSQNEFLKSEQQRLESEMKEAEARSREQEMLIRQQQQQQQQQQQIRSSSGSQKYFDNSFAPPRQFSSLTRQSPTPSSFEASTSTPNPFGSESRSTGSSSSRALGHFGQPPTRSSSDHDESILEAMRLQNEFDKEDRALSAQRAQLAKSAQRLFECGICMEEMPDDSIARPDSCGHAFCRECLHRHVTARLDEHRFPILCPTCTADKGKGKKAAGGTCCERTVNLVIISRYVLRGLAVPCPRPWAHRRAIQYLDRDGNGFILYSLKLSKVRLWYSLISPSFNTGIGANGRCSWPETNMKKLRSSLVHFRTAPMRGASSVSSRSTLMVQSTRAMVHRN